MVIPPRELSGRGRTSPPARTGWRSRPSPHPRSEGRIAQFPDGVKRKSRPPVIPQLGERTRRARAEAFSDSRQFPPDKRGWSFSGRTFSGEELRFLSRVCPGLPHRRHHEPPEPRPAPLLLPRLEEPRIRRNCCESHPKALASWPRALVFSLRVVLFTLSSMTARECWQVVLGSQWMLLAQREIRKTHAGDRKKDGRGNE